MDGKSSDDSPSSGKKRDCILYLARVFGASQSLRASLTVWGWIGLPLVAWSQMSRGVIGLSQLS